MILDYIKLLGDEDEFYILGKVSDHSNDVEMLVDTQPADVYDNPEDSGMSLDKTQDDIDINSNESKENDSDDNLDVPEVDSEEIKTKYDFVPLPKKMDMIKDMYPKYGEDLNPKHEELIEYLMNLLIEQNPEAAEEVGNDEDVETTEPDYSVEDTTSEEIPTDNNREEETEEDE